MLNRFTAILLLIALVTVNFSRFFVYAGFELNKTYIATKLCENRDKPWMHCNGKCYFMNKIKQLQEKEKSDERHTQKDLFQEAFFTTDSAFQFHNQLLLVIDTPYQISLLNSFNRTLFQPPQQA